MTYATYTTQTEADTFVRIFNFTHGKGRHAKVVRAAPGAYQVTINEPKQYVWVLKGAA